LRSGIGPRIQGMNAAYDYEDLHHLVDRPPPPRGVDTGARSLAGVLAIIGTVDGPEDLAERHDHHIRQRLRQRFDPT
jgi:hypothetical protein